MKLSVGMYVRTKYGHIAKLIYIDYEDEYYKKNDLDRTAFNVLRKWLEKLNR